MFIIFNPQLSVKGESGIAKKYALKNLQYLPNHYETWSKCATSETVILIKFHKD